MKIEYDFTFGKSYYFVISKYSANIVIQISSYYVNVFNTKIDLIQLKESHKVA